MPQLCAPAQQPPTAVRCSLPLGCLPNSPPTAHRGERGLGLQCVVDKTRPETAWPRRPTRGMIPPAFRRHRTNAQQTSAWGAATAAQHQAIAGLQAERLRRVPYTAGQHPHTPRHLGEHAAIISKAVATSTQTPHLGPMRADKKAPGPQGATQRGLLSLCGNEACTCRPQQYQQAAGPLCSHTAVHLPTPVSTQDSRLSNQQKAGS